MTEQEKREKAIEEMAKDIELSCDTNNDIARCRELNDCSRCQARYLIEKCHYRKAEEVQKECDKNAYNAWKGAFGVKEKAIREEVRKETVKKIFAELRSHCMTSETENCYGEVVIPKSYTWWEDDLNKLEKKFGVEVEE